LAHMGWVQGSRVRALGWGALVAATLFPGVAAAWPVAPTMSPPCQAGEPCETAAPASGPALPTAPEAVPPANAAAAPTTGSGEAAAVEPPPAAAVAPVSPQPAADAEDPRVRAVGRPSPAGPPTPAPEFTIPARFFLLSLGAHVFVGKGSDGVDPGVRASLLWGGRVSSTFSAGAELVADYVNPSDTGGSSLTEWMFDLTFSPLFHAPLGRNAQFVIGPRLGLFGVTFSVSGQSVSGQSASIDGWALGWAAGANAGVLGPLGSAQAGFLFSLGTRTPEKLCYSGSGQDECISEGFSTAKVVGIAALLML
jgi:hypothetical protein